MLIDSHCHLDRLDLSAIDEDIPGVLAAARARGVSGFLCVGIALEQLPAMMAIVDAYDDVYASAGHHPLEKASAAVPRADLLRWGQDQRIVAIGETGLDYYYQKGNARQQMDNFITHLQVASEIGKPVIVHSRDAREDTLQAIKQNAGGAGGVLHCFTENWEMASRAIDMGFYISLSGIVTFRNAAELREVAKKIPLDRLLVETDSPYLAPVPYRGKSNQPAYVREVAQCIADLREISLDTLASHTTENFNRLFHIVESG